MIRIIDDLTAWLQNEVCDKLEYKKPAERGSKEGAGYDYKRVKPTAYPCYCPPQDMAQVPAAPSVTIQIDNFSDDLNGENDINIALVFVIWNTGEHTSGGFKKTFDGWRDLWQFMDKTRGEIKKNVSIAGYEVTSDIKGRPLHGDSAILGTYPYFFGELTFSIKSVTSYERNKEIRDLL